MRLRHTVEEFFLVLHKFFVTECCFSLRMKSTCRCKSTFFLVFALLIECSTLNTPLSSSEISQCSYFIVAHLQCLAIEQYNLGNSFFCLFIIPWYMCKLSSHYLLWLLISLIFACNWQQLHDTSSVFSLVIYLPKHCNMFFYSSSS